METILSSIFNTRDNIGKEIDMITFTKVYISSWIDLNSTSNPSLKADSGFEKSLCSSCNYDIK